MFAIDVGGTFTDAVMIHQDGELTTRKSPTTPADPAEGMINALERIATAVEEPLEDLLAQSDVFFHATTLATNITIEETGATVGLLTTRGHEDAGRIGRMTTRHAGLSTPELKDYVTQSKQPPFASRDNTIGISERIDRNGDVVVPVAESEVIDAANELHDQGVDIIAVSFLWSFVNSRHEQRAKELIEQQVDVPVMLSSDIAPRLGEYERGATTSISAYVAPQIHAYLSRIEEQLRMRGLDAPFLVMQSNGGVLSGNEMHNNEASMLLSGPAAGVTGAANGRFDAAKTSNVICTDVGGTSFDVGLVVNGEPQTTPSMTINQHTLYQQSIQIETIGSGGGSIAWLGSENELNIGPRSAGADPGPACYQNGNEEPTITDADLVLGLLDPEYFLGGELEVSKSAAEAAIETQIADPLGVAVPDAARGVYDLMNAQMADLIRKVTVENGHDPGEFTVFAYGGAGPMHATGYCQELGIDEVTAPLGNAAAVFSAYGLTTADIRRVNEISRPMSEPFDMERLAAIYRDLRDSVASELEASPAALSYTLEADIRYEGQYSELAVELPASILDPEYDSSKLNPKELFETRYVDRYGESAKHRSGGVEIINQRVAATQSVRETEIAGEALTTATPSPEKKREVVWTDGARETDIYFEDPLVHGASIQGPAVIQLPSTTIPVPPQAAARVNEQGSITVDLAEGEA
jgi:N-methylhydantoinase A